MWKIVLDGVVEEGVTEAITFLSALPQCLTSELSSVNAAEAVRMRDSFVAGCVQRLNDARGQIVSSMPLHNVCISTPTNAQCSSQITTGNDAEYGSTATTNLSTINSQLSEAVFANRRLQRSLSLLQAILDEYAPQMVEKRQGIASDPHAHRFCPDEYITVGAFSNIMGSKTKGSKRNVRICSGPHATVWDMRVSLAAAMGKKAREVRVVCRGKVLDNNHITVQTLGLVNGDTVHITGAAAAATVSSSSSAGAGVIDEASSRAALDDALPAELLSTVYFSSLFEIFATECDAAVAGAAWGLLMRIPTNPGFFQELEDLPNQAAVTAEGRNGSSVLWAYRFCFCINPL
jgi:hypothetical protein